MKRSRRAFAALRQVHPVCQRDLGRVEKGLVATGLPEFAARSVRGLDEEAARGYQAILSPAVKDLTGQAPTSLEDFLRVALPAMIAGPFRMQMSPELRDHARSNDLQIARLTGQPFSDRYQWFAGGQLRLI